MDLVRGESLGRVYTFIDLFAGAGGLSLGFTLTGKFRSVFAVELDAAAASTYRRNFGKYVPGTDLDHVWDQDIRLLPFSPVQADVIIGGPPCQGFSPLGKISPREEHAAMNQLFREYFRIVDQVRPLAFVIENVPEILKSQEFIDIQKLSEQLGYTLTFDEMHAIQFGVPQRRKRAIIIGMREGVKPFLPSDTGVRKTVRDAIGDIPPEPTTLEPVDRADGTQDLHIARRPTAVSVERYKCIPPGGNRFDLMRERPDITPRCWLEKPTGTTDVFGRLEWDQPAYTIRTEFFKPEKGCYLHPEQHRPITHREAARLQTFPDDFYFCGSKIEIARQIGNAVPPLLAKAVATALLEQLPEVDRIAEMRNVVEVAAAGDD